MFIKECLVTILKVLQIKQQTSSMSLTNLSGIYTSKIRYGLQLIGKVRTEVHESSQSDLNALQKTQNRLIRLLSGTKLSNKISTGSLLKNLKMLSVNQLNAQIKLTEIWKAVNNENHPISVKKSTLIQGERELRSKFDGKLIESGFSNLAKDSFLSDAIRLWNKAPDAITKCSSIYSVKKEIKVFVKTLPI